MAAAKVLVRAWFSYGFAFCGISESYLDIRSGRFLKSRGLCIYRLLLSALLVCSFCYMTFAFWLNNSQIPTKSQLMRILVLIQPATATISILSSSLCTHYRQRTISKMVSNLFSMENIIDASVTLGRTPAEQLYLRRIFSARMLAVLLEIVCLTYHLVAGSKSFVFSLNVLGSKFVTDGLVSLMFIVLWQICNNLLKVQLLLDQSQSHRQSLSGKVRRLLQVHRLYYKLMRDISDFCQVFKYPLGCWLFKVICNSCMTGYFLFRNEFVMPFDVLTPVTRYILITVGTSSLLQLYLMATLAHFAGRLHDNTFRVLRRSQQDSLSIERLEDWLALQLTWQNKQISIFGVLNLNLNWIFLIFTGIVMHVIYILQSDYKLLQ